jgi:multidrug efflux system outer membrane protein
MYVKWILFAPFLLIPMHLAAQKTGGAEREIKVITLRDALSMAENANLTLKKSEIDLAAARRAQNYLYAQFFPSISLGASASYGSFGIAKPAVKEPSPSWGIQAGLSLQLSAAIPASMSLVRLAYQSGLLNYENSKKQIEISVSKSFYRLIAGKQNILILRERHSQAEREAALALVSYNNGLMNELNYSRSQLSVQQALYELRRAESAYRQDVDTFIVSIGQDDAIPAAGIEIKLEGEIAIEQYDLDAEELIARFLPSRPDIAAARQAVEKAQLNLAVRRMQNKAPSLSLSSRYSGKPESGYSDSLDFSLSVSVPLDSWIPGTAANQQEWSAEADLQKAKLDLSNTESEARRSIRSFCETLTTSWETITMARKSAQIAGRTYEMSVRAFRDGAAASRTVEDDRQSLASARQNLLVEELNYKLALLDLAQALNTNLFLPSGNAD